MKIIIDPNKNVYENASIYFEESKRLKKKLEETEKAIEQTKKEIAIETKQREEQHLKEIKNEKERILLQEKKNQEKKEWYHQYHWFFTSDNFLVIAGKSAGQNEELVKKRLEDNDLFFHADIVGAPATILKNGRNAPESSLRQAAQFAACYSSAWKTGYSIVDVYYVYKEQVSKSPPSGQYLEKGSFFISGRKNYYRSMPLKLLIGVDKDGVLRVVPEEYKTDVFSICFLLEPGRYSKDIVAEKLSKQLGIKKDEIILSIPTGNTSFTRIK